MATNPLFDDNSDKVLRFKDGVPEAIEHFVNLIDQNFNLDWKDCYCIAVPSHDPNKNYSPVHELIKRLTLLHKNLQKM